MKDRLNVLVLLVAATLPGVYCSGDEFESIMPDISILDSDQTTVLAKLDFGAVPEQSSFSKDIYVKNTVETSADLNFTLSVLDTAGAAAADGVVTFSPENGSLKGSALQKVTATFAPKEAREYSYTMLVESNAQTAANRRIEIPITGSGMTPKIEVDDTTLDFGDVHLGSTKAMETTIRNTGSGTLTISTIIRDDAADVFSLSQPDSRTLPLKIEPDSMSKFIVVFSPSAIAAFTGKFTLNNDDPEPGRRAFVINVLGNGVPPPQNQPPTAAIACPEGGIQLAVPGEVELDASGSTDPDEDTMTYHWTVKKDASDKDMIPEGSDYCFDCNRGQLTRHKDSTKQKPKFYGDLVGDYTVQLVVMDDNNNFSDPVDCVIHGYASQQLHIELLWNNPMSDIDLHLVNNSAGITYKPPDTGGVFTCPCDCNTSYNRNPDWGLPIPYTAACANPLGNACDLACRPTMSDQCQIDPDDPSTARNPACYRGGESCVLTCEPDTSSPGYQDAVDDNPKLDIDDTSGYGPENINIVKPSEGLYHIFVHYFDDYGTKNSDATIRLYINGRTKPEWRFGPKTMTGKGQLWDVAMIQWPASPDDDAVVTTIDGLRDANPVTGATCTLPRDGGAPDGGAPDAGIAPDGPDDAGVSGEEPPDGGA